MFKCLQRSVAPNPDVVIFAVPLTVTVLPIMAPAVLKSVVESTGHSCLAVDLNQEVLQYVNQHPQHKELRAFFFTGKIAPEAKSTITQLMETIARQCVELGPKWIGLSLLTLHCQAAAKWLCLLIRKFSPKTKIVIGGPGCLTSLTGHSDFVNFMFKSRAIDYYIRGDAELSFKALLEGNDSYPGINDVTWQQLTQEQLESVPLPDYQDYDFDSYSINGIAVLASRGCVRQCTFCDYITNWTQFVWRKAENVFEEMVTQYNKYGLSRFKFNDSLINGNMKEYMRLLEMLAEFNQSHPEKPMTWASFFIFREPTASSDREWELLAKSGAKFLQVGIENLNESIRHDMGKKFSNAAIEYHLAKAQQYGILISALMISGYINEQQHHVDYAKQWLRDHTQYRDIVKFTWSLGLGIFENTHLGNNKQELGITIIDANPHNWRSIHTNSTVEMRAQWARECMALCEELGFTINIVDTDQHMLLEQAL